MTKYLLITADCDEAFTRKLNKAAKEGYRWDMAEIKHITPRVGRSKVLHIASLIKD